MPNFTPNLNLKKPLTTEYYNIADFNDNMDVLDGALEIASQSEAEAGINDDKLMTPIKVKQSIDYNDKSPVVGNVSTGSGIGPFSFTLPVEPSAVYVFASQNTFANASHNFNGLVTQGESNIYLYYSGSSTNVLIATLSGNTLTLTQGSSTPAFKYNYVLYR